MRGSSSRIWTSLLLLLAVALGPVALSAHFHPGARDMVQRPCDLCILAHHTTAVHHRVEISLEPRRQHVSVHELRLVTPAQAFRPFFRGRAPPAPSLFA